MKPLAHKNSKLPRFLLFAIISLLIAAGVTLIGNGLWIKAKAQLAQVLLNQAFERVQSTPYGEEVNAKPWRWADIKPIARLTAPRLTKSAIVLNNTSGEALAFGPGHMPNTPLPGERGTSVLAAHRDTHFSWIRNLEKGDKVEVENANGTKAVFSVKRSWVAPYNVAGLNVDSDNRLLALSTCYPFNAKTRGPLRYIVEAELINNEIDISKLEN